ncbi:MAG: porin family protein [Candidatus Cryptobacteroides sp.]
MAKDWTSHLKEKIDNYAETPGEDVWEGVAERAGIARRRPLPVWIPSLAAAAALVAGVFLVTRSNDVPEDVVAVAERPVNEDNMLAFNDVESDNVKLETESAAVALKETKVAPVAQKETMVARLALKKAAESGADVNNPAAFAARTDTAMESAITEETVAGTVQAVEPKESVDSVEPEENLQYATWTDWEEPKATKKKKGFTVGIGASGSGRAAGSLNRPTALAMGANPLLSNDSGTAWTSAALKDKVGSLTFDQPEVQTEYSHRIPVKIGLTARYNIGRFGLETGLDYSILTSDLKTGEEGKTWSKGTQTLQYIGIPVNASFNFLDKRYVTLYISAGGEMEKCVRGRTKTDEYEDGKYLRTTDNSLKVKPLQWSVNAAAGVQVNILRNLGAYVEPGVVHHFDNGAKVRSSYTDRPTDFSLRFGLRYSFGL